MAERRFRSIAALAACVIFLSPASRAEMTPEEINQAAAAIAARLAETCPRTTPDDHTAFESCQAAYRFDSPLPFASSVLWGPDQVSVPMRKKRLTVVQGWVWQYLYMPNYGFTGRWSVGRDTIDKVDYIAVETYFRNALPQGDYPYPFWHSDAKWNGDEKVNQFKLYLDAKGKIFMVGRSTEGSEEHRGPYAHVTPPAFDGKWQWTDAEGRAQPHATLFSSRYSVGNPYLPVLDETYRTFALGIRDGTCLSCHTPLDKAEVNRLVLMQTPMHAAGSIDGVLREVESGEMPQDDIGLRKEIDPALRETILTTGRAFQAALRHADEWEGARKR
jgi:hypothetical protein